MGLPLTTVQYIDNGGGLNLRNSPTKVPEDEASLALNIDYDVDGAILTRYGSSITNVTAGVPQQMAGAPKTLLEFDYRKSDGTQVNVICAGTTIKTSLTTPTNAITGLSAALPHPDMEFVVTGDNEYLIWGNGIDENLKFDGTTWTNLSMPRATAPTLTDFAAGLLPAGNYYYYVSFARTVGGVIVQESELSPISSVLTIAANRQIRVTIPTCSETLATGVTAQCNARVIYRISPTSVGVAYRITTVADNVTTTYDDNVAADGTIEAEYNNQAPPKSAIIETDDFGQTWFVDTDNTTDVYVSKGYKPWNAPDTDFVIFDGGVQCAKRCFGTIIFGTNTSLWVQNGSFATAEPRKISSLTGILNNRCAAGESELYILATNRKMYKIYPTSFSQNEIRISDDLSDKVNPLFNSITSANIDECCMVHYQNARADKIVLSCPIGTATNNSLLIYNVEQSTAKKKPVWQYWTGIKASALCIFNISNNINLYSGDYNGFLWQLDDTGTNGDGSEENGTATAAGASTLTDSTATWVVNEHTGKNISILYADGTTQTQVVASNTGTQITTLSAWSPAVSAGVTYTIGGYDKYQFTNWKSVNGSYDALKQLWYIFSNLNASGDYPVEVIIQTDFDQSLSNSTSLNINLSSSNAIWGAFDWGDALWGSRSVFQSRLRQFLRFRAVRLGFRNRKAGQPFQLNTFSLSVQNKGLFYGSAQ